MGSAARKTSPPKVYKRFAFAISKHFEKFARRSFLLPAHLTMFSDPICDKLFGTVTDVDENIDLLNEPDAGALTARGGGSGR